MVKSINFNKYLKKSKKVKYNFCADNTGTQKDCPCGSSDPDCIPITIYPNDPYLGIDCTNPSRADNTNGGNINCAPGVSNITCIKLTRSSASPLFNCSTGE